MLARCLVTVVASLALVCVAVRTTRAQDVSALFEEFTGGAGSDDEKVTVIDLLADGATLDELQLDNSQRERVAAIVAVWQKQQNELNERQQSELSAVSSTTERIRRRAAHRRESREQVAKWREVAAQGLAEVLNEQQVKALETKLSAAGDSAGLASDGRTNSATPASASPAVRTAETVASFGATTPTTDEDSSDVAAPNASAEDSAGDATDRVAFNFYEAPWTDVLKLFADAAGLTLHIRETPPGLFTYFDRRSYTPTEALDVMNRYLLQDGFLLVRHDRFLTVLDATKGVPPNLIETVTPDQLDERGATELLRVSLPLGDRDAAKAAEEIRALLGPQGKVAPLESAGSVVVTDIGANLRRVQRLLEPPPVVPDAELTFRSFPLVHIDAESAAVTVRSLFGVASGMTNVSAGGGGGDTDRSSRDRDRGSRGFPGPADFMRRFGGGGRDDNNNNNDRGGAPGSDQQEPNKANNTKVAVDRRTNSVLVTATAEQMKLVAQVIEAIDVVPGETTAFDRGGTVSEPYLEVYELESADPQETAKTLSVLHPGLVVNEDGRARRIHIWATPEEHREIAMHIRQLDGAAAGESLAVIPLQGLNAYEVSTTLTSLFAGDAANAPSIAYDPSGRGLIVRGSASQVTQIRMLIGQLGMQEPNSTGAGRAHRADRAERRPVHFAGHRRALPASDGCQHAGRC
ncbi:MAG: secretin N-terminal domain-containing protein [Pirellulales bacterium]